MTEAYVVIPIAIATIIGFVGELQDLSHEVSDRSLQYAEDAVAALDCAYEARPITECSPDITNPDFKTQIEETNELLTALQDA